MARILNLLFLFLLMHGPSLAVGRDLEKLYTKESFRLDHVAFKAYVADDNSRRSDGLMYISKLPENTGMLFIFESEQILSFWMKNTLIPLSIGFFDSKGNLVDIQEMEPARSMVQLNVPTYQSRKPATFALEMNRGWFSRHKIKVGARLRLTSKARSQLLLKKLGSPESSRH